MKSIILPLALFLAVLSPGTPSAMAQASAVHPALPEIPAGSFNITDYGAVGDGIATNTVAIQQAIDAASAAGGGTVDVPAGIFLCGPIDLADRIRLTLDSGAILRMLPLAKYPGGMAHPPNFISGRGLHDLALSGAGAIDGQGSAWWPFVKGQNISRPRMIALSGCDRVLIENVTLSNSPMFHLALSRASNVTVRGVTIHANASTDPVLPSHNTDACDVSGKNILVENCDVSVGDDDFTCGGGTSDVLITNCTYGYGHGVSVGSYTRGVVSNITVINCTFHDTETGIQVKTDRDRGGFVHDLSYLNLSMTNVKCPIRLNCSYNSKIPKNYADIPANSRLSEVLSTTPIYRNITISNLTASVPSGSSAGIIRGLPEMCISNVLLAKLNITSDKPMGIYYAQGVRVVDSKIVTPEGVNQLSSGFAQVTVSP